MRRHELSDEEWALVEPVLPVQRKGGRGRPRKTNREMLNGMMWGSAGDGGAEDSHPFPNLR